jgi:hypothetical protein
MDTLEKIEFIQKKLLFLNTCLAGSLLVGDILEITRYRTEIEQFENEHKSLLKDLENANR